jgi:hypothetical protein
LLVFQAKIGGGKMTKTDKNHLSKEDTEFPLGFCHPERSRTGLLKTVIPHLLVLSNVEGMRNPYLNPIRYTLYAIRY